MQKTAIVLGATGLTGRNLVEELLRNDAYSKITLFSRSTLGRKDAKLEEHLVDLFKLEDYKDNFIADHVFCCIGTTKSKTPDKETYKKIDHGIPVTAAKLSAKNGAECFTVISAMGADANSKIFYNQTKGKMEQDVMVKNVPNIYIIRPALIVGDREEKRFFEKLATHAFKIFNFMLVGKLKKYRSVKSVHIAKTMIEVANYGYPDSIIKSNKISELATTYDGRN
ncbi:NAD-dependent epimerase/dehydratase family protein [Zunongwangia endophytica]|uniref:NAD-dependent epimerase/dehydratase family protein n=1 Tax=Zunongwangia endophytica TaxID=1808945 RepID=A0ABV8H5Z4_9FLAO|nr:NAD(P)H-binding protein [Zunongwangia endophytica]MDN3596072.1 NAD(P)H-binding protein [Zunongwangia endophytica]